ADGCSQQPSARILRRGGGAPTVPALGDDRRRGVVRVDEGGLGAVVADAGRGQGHEAGRADGRLTLGDDGLARRRRLAGCCSLPGSSRRALSTLRLGHLETALTEELGSAELPAAELVGRG